MSDLLQEAQALLPFASELRHQIHADPELGLKEYHTTQLIRRVLTDLGVELVSIPIETGVVGLIRGTKPGEGPVTALRADIDALPITEETGRPYGSKNVGVMHACGHDGHTAILLGAARLLMTHRDKFSGIVKLIFQPGEESGNGAEKMIRAGVLEAPEVDSIAALHGWPTFQVGQVGAWPGQYMASSDEFQITVTGKSGHGCRPYLAVNPIVAAAQIVTALQNIVASEIITSQQAVVSICQFHSGSGPTSIPDQAVLEGTMRCLDEQIRTQIKERLCQVAEHTAQAFGCGCRCDFLEGSLPALNNDPDTVKKLLTSAEKVLGKEAVCELSGPVMGAEDFSFFAETVKRTVFFRLGLDSSEDEARVLHNSHFDFNDDAIPFGIAVLAQYVIDASENK